MRDSSIFLVKDSVVYIAVAAVILLFVILTISEILFLKFVRKADRLRFIGFPIFANFVGLVVFLTVSAGAAAAAFVFIPIATYAGSPGQKKELYLLTALSLLSIPVLIFVFRLILCFLFRLGKFSFAASYSLVSTVLSLVLAAGMLSAIFWIGRGL